MARALIPLRLDLRDPSYQDFIESNRQSGKLVATEEQSMLAANVTLTVLALPHHAEGHRGRSLTIPFYRFHMPPDTADMILNIC